MHTLSAAAAGQDSVPKVPIWRGSISSNPRFTAFGETGPVGGDLGTPAHAEFGEQVRDVVLDGLLGEEHALADLAVGQALGDQLEDRAVPAG